MPPTRRLDGRANDELRSVTITRNWLDHAEGSVLVEFGRTRVLCAASVTEGVPRWRKGSGLGWVTGEYAMLPRATTTRNERESVKGRLGGRTQEISRLVGRALRAVRRLQGARGGDDSTRLRRVEPTVARARLRSPVRTSPFTTPSSGCAHTARCLASPWCVRCPLSALASSTVRQDSILNYEEDVRADTDMNVVVTGDGEFIEVQGTAERDPLRRTEIDALLDLAVGGCARLDALQRAALGIS